MSTAKLGDFITLEYGKPLPDERRTDSGQYPIFGANGAKGATDQSYWHEPSIIVGRKGSAGELTLTEGGFWPLDVTYFIKHDCQITNLRFIWYLLQTLNLPSLAKGIKPGINRNEVYALPAQIPPLKEQERIVAILDDALAALGQTRNDVQRSLLLVDGLVASFCSTLFQARDSWPVKALPEISQNQDGKRIPITKGARVHGEYPYYGASGVVDHVANFLFDYDTLLVSEDGANLLARSTPIAFRASGKYWVNNHAHVLRFESQVTQRFVELYLESIPLDRYVTGAAQPKLTQAALNSIPIPIPNSLEEQLQIVERYDVLTGQTKRVRATLEAKLREIRSLEQSLLHAAFSGNL